MPAQKQSCLLTGCVSLLCISLADFSLAAQTVDSAAQAISELRAFVQTAPPLALERTEFSVHPPAAGWALGMVSSVAVDGNGAKATIYLLQRGDKADPIVAVDREGRFLRSWGKGLYKIPHSIRVAPDGNIWTVDAQSSTVLKFTPEGKKLMQIDVGGQPENSRNPFCGTTDIAFAPNGHLFISDGYANARILEYTADGRRIREWGTKGAGPGQFRLPHGIAVDANGIVYVADRENGRIQRFDSNGRYLDQWGNLGKAFSVRLSGGAVWAGIQPRVVENGSSGWLIELDPATGKIIGYADSTGGHHLIEVTSSGELITGVKPDKVQWFRALSAR
jgi:DNA-binding beta-propeller fold protein YncE